MGVIYRTFKNAVVLIIVVLFILIGVWLIVFLPVKASDNSRPVIIIHAGHGRFS